MQSASSLATLLARDIIELIQLQVIFGKSSTRERYFSLYYFF